MTELDARTGSDLGAPGASSTSAENLPTGERSHLRVAVRRFLHHRLAMASLLVFVSMLFFAFIAPSLWQWGHEIDRSIPPNVPWFEDWSHPLGTSQIGHDLTAQMMRGARNSILVGLLAASIGTTLGTVVGLVSGYYGGWVDSTLMRLVDIVIVVPFLVVVLVVAGAFTGGTSWYSVAMLIGMFAWTIDSRIVRGQVLALREREFIEASHAMGASHLRIITMHLFPNVISTVLVVFTLSVAAAIIVEAILSFLGFGIRPPDVSLGFLIDSARTAVRTRPWLFYTPGILIVMIVLCINFIGDGLRDALDPKQAKVRR